MTRPPILYPPSERRQRVDAVMQHWQSYPDFATLFNDLLKANNMNIRQLADAVNDVLDSPISQRTIENYKNGIIPPSYTFLEGLLQSNALYLEPSRITKETVAEPAGDQRIALFTKANLIEVTPSNIEQFNKDVFAGLQRHMTHTHMPKLHWVDIMLKLLDFHCQGERISTNDIQQ